jgi:hypothetical protein
MPPGHKLSSLGALLDGTFDRTLDWTLDRPVRLEIGLVLCGGRGRPRRTLDGTLDWTLDWAVSLYLVLWPILIRHRALLLGVDADTRF